MCQSPLRLAFLAAQPIRKPQSPTAYLRACRAYQARLLTSTAQKPRTSTPLTSRASFSRPASRQFSTSRPKQATVVLQNPRTDDDGRDMTIEISERAAKRLRQITSSPPSKNTLISSPSSSQDSHLRVTVTSGGCHGFQYLMALEEAAKIDAEEDTIFEYTQSAPEAETKPSAGKAEVVMDSASLELLKGSTIDFTQELIGSQFKVVGNPRATSSCGCGTSFDIE